MAESTVWTVLKWILAVLAAGFVGQFGRVLAMRLIERRRRTTRVSPTTQSPTASVPLEVSLKQEQARADAKIEKKRSKAAVKRAKKGDDA